MFEFDAGKLLIIAIVARIFIGPKDLPRVMRQVGQAVGKLRRMGAEFQAQFMEAMNEAGADDLKADVNKLKDSTKIDLGFDPVHATKTELMSAVHQLEAPVKPPEIVAPVVISEPAAEPSHEAAPVVARASD